MATTIPAPPKPTALEVEAGEQVGKWLVVETKPSILRLAGAMRPIVYVRASTNQMDDFGRYHTIHTDGWFPADQPLQPVLDYWGQVKMSDLNLFDDEC